MIAKEPLNGGGLKPSADLDLSDRDYHSIPAISSSGINTFIKSPMKYWKESPFNPDRDFDSDTEALRLGRAAHLLLLEPEKEDEEIVVCPEYNLRTKADKESFEILKKSAKDAGQTWLRDTEYESVKAMIEIAKKNPLIKSLMKGGRAEEPVFWDREVEEDEDPILCKAKLDFNRAGLVIDYKTTRSTKLEEFRKSVANFGYHRQAALYMEAYEQLTGEEAKGFICIAQDKMIPEDIAAYVIAPDDINIGSIETDYAIKDMAKRLKSGVWDSHPQKIEPISLPHWYMPTYAEGE